MDGMLAAYENIAHGFLDEVIDEISYRGFRPEIACITARKPIHSPCVLREHRVIGSPQMVRAIEIEESFLQFLWCIAFSTYVIHQELIIQPMLKGQKPKEANKEDRIIQQAIRVGEAGTLLMKSVSPRTYFDLPNPETPTKEYSGYIEAANQLFFISSAFILLHEVGHQFLGHLEVVPSSASKDEEFQADLYAADWIKQGLGDNPMKDILLTHGTMVAMLAMLLLHKDLDGGPAHPHPDERVLRILSHLSLSDNDPVWFLGILGLPTWIATHGKVRLNITDDWSSPKDLFSLGIQQLVESRPPDWS